MCETQHCILEGIRSHRPGGGAQYHSISQTRLPAPAPEPCNMYSELRSTIQQAPCSVSRKTWARHHAPSQATRLTHVAMFPRHAPLPHSSPAELRHTRRYACATSPCRMCPAPTRLLLVSARAPCITDHSPPSPQLTAHRPQAKPCPMPHASGQPPACLRSPQKRRPGSLPKLH